LDTITKTRDGGALKWWGRLAASATMCRALSYANPEQHCVGESIGMNSAKGTVGGGSAMNMGMAIMGGAPDSKPGITSRSLKIMDPQKDSVLLAMAVTFNGSQPVNVASKALAQSIKDNHNGTAGSQKQ
jgi:hypothetical protein